MRQRIIAPARLEGEIALPGDKSISHRAALLNSIATGTAQVTNFCVGDDRASMLRCLRGLHVDIEHEPSPTGNETQDRFIIHGKGPDGLSEPDEILDSGNSGTTMRLVSGLLASRPFFSVITGDESLRSRPMDRIVRPLQEMGAQVMGRGGGSKAPLAFRGGGLHGIDYQMPVASAQLKSCLLIAGLSAQGRTVVREPAATRDHTERMLEAMGADVERDGLRIAVRPSDLTAIDVRVPGDISSAAFWLVAGAVHPQAQVLVRGVSVNPSRTGVLEILRSMGARLTLENLRFEGGEEVADIQVESSDLHATEIAGSLVPRAIDELPVLAVAACFAQGTTVIRDAAELRTKETDRIRAMAQELCRMGGQVEETPDGLIIRGPTSLRGADCRSHGDHRVAMAVAVAGLLAQGETTLADAEAAAVSYPGFWQQMTSLAGKAEQ